MTQDELKKRFKDWAVTVVLFTRNFSNQEDLKVIRNQIIRSGTSSAANYRAACRAKSTSDFINKLKIVEEELDETLFWLEFIVSIESNLRQDIVPIYKEGNELLAIIVASIKKSRQNKSEKS